MRINEMFNGAPKAPTNTQPETMYVEDSGPQLVVLYPGRFQPFHLGHKDVFQHLMAKFGRDHVFISTGNMPKKIDKSRHIFGFTDKLQFMHAAGIPDDRVIQNQSPYTLPPQFDKENTIYLIAVGAPDVSKLDVGGVYTGKTPTGRAEKIPDGKSIGDEKYYLPFKSLAECKTADQHAYVVVAQERKVPVTIGGKQYDASHGTACRALWNKVRKNAKQRGEFLTQLYGRNDPELGRLLDKIPLDESYGDVSALPVDTISPIHGGTVKENTEPNDSELFGDQSTVILHKVNEVIDRFTNTVRGSLDRVLAEIGVENVNDIKNATDAHGSDIEFAIERVGLLKFLDALKKAFNRSKEDGINLLRSGWSELDPSVNFNGMRVDIPISEICDELASELREKHNVDITGLMWNTPLSESSEPDDEELFGKEEPIIFKLSRLLKNKQPVHIRLLNGKVWQVLEVHPVPSSKYFANIVYGKLGPDGSRHGSMSMTKMLDQRKLSLTHTNDGYIVIQNSADKWTLNDLSETSEPNDEELFGKEKLPLIQAYEFLEKSKSVYIEVPRYQNEVFAVLSVYMDERNPRRHSDSVTFINKGYKTEEVEVNQDKLTIIPYKNGYLLKKTVNETTDPSDDELFGKRYEDRIADGMVDYAKQIEDELSSAHPSWKDHEHTIRQQKAARASRQLADSFRKGGVEAGKGMINALMKMPNYLWLYDLHDFMKDHRGINLHDLYGDARRLEENEPNDDELFGNRPTALSPKDIVDGLRGYVNELQEYASKWDERTSVYADYMAGILELNDLINTFEQGGLRAGIPAFKELNLEWNGEILVQLKNNYGVDLTKVLTRNSVSENSEPSDDELFGDDYEVFDDPSEWTDYNGVMRRKRDIMRRDFLKDYTAPNGDIAIYLRNDDNQVVGAFYAPHNSKKRIGTFIKYGGAKTIEDYMSNDPHCPFNKLSEDAAGVGVVKNSKDPRYVMATMGDQNDVTADTMPRQLRAYGLTGRKLPKLGRERR